MSKRDVRFIAQNLNFGTGPKADRRTLRHLAGLPKRLIRVMRGRRPAPKLEQPTVLLLQEAKNLRSRRHRVAYLLGGLFRGIQDTSSPARAGSAIFSRGIRVWTLHLWLLGKFRGTLPRWAVQGHCRIRRQKFGVLSIHDAPKRSGVHAQVEALLKVRRRLARMEDRGWSWVVGGDFNMDIRIVARILGGTAYGEGIVGIITSHDTIVTRAGVDTWAVGHRTSDHPAPWVEVAGSTRRKR